MIRSRYPRQVLQTTHALPSEVVDRRDARGMTPLIRTASWTQYDLVTGEEQRSAAEAERLLRAGADVNASDREGRTALMWAADRHHPDLLAVLLRHAPAINARDRRGRTALTWGARWNSDLIGVPLRQAGAAVGVTEALLLRDARGALAVIDASAPLDVPGPRGETPLMLACGLGDLGIVDALLRRGIRVGARDDRGRTALMYAIGNEPLRIFPGGIRLPQEDEAEADRPALVRLLRGQGADPNARDRESGETILIKAADYSTSDTVRALVAAGAAIDGRGRRGETPLIRAIRQKRPEMVDALLSLGANPRLADDEGVSPLHHAASAFPDAVGPLLRHRADPNARSRSGRTPLMHTEDHDVIRALVSAGARVGLMEALHLRDAGRVRRLLERGEHPRRLGPALNLAARLGMEEAVVLLLDREADVNARDNSPGTPLMAASSSGQTRIVKRLIAAGADLNAQNRLGWTALMWAAFMGHEESAALLLRAGADPNVRARSGQTALSLALRQGTKAAVELLKAAGAVETQRRQDDLPPH